jgi:hypothetical protein
MIIFRRASFQLYTCAQVAQVLAIMVALSAALLAMPPTKSPSNVWYTQIGQWHIWQKGSLSGRSFLFHDSRIDGARSGQATANVRFNFAFKDIRRCEAHLALGPAPASAGLLLQNKQVTYYFLIERKTTSDTLRICRSSDSRMVSLFGVAVNVSDTTLLTLSVKSDSLWLSADTIKLSVAKPPEFPNLSAVGFECPQGSVKVFYVHIEAQNNVVEESFGKATLVNLHLEKMLLGGGKNLK